MIIVTVCSSPVCWYHSTHLSLLHSASQPHLLIRPTPYTCLCFTLPVSHASSSGQLSTPVTALAAFKPAPVSASVPDCSCVMPDFPAVFPGLITCCRPRLSPTCLPASSLPWILPQPSVFDHEFRLCPPGYTPARLCGYTAHHWTCLPAR